MRRLIKSSALFFLLAVAAATAKAANWPNTVSSTLNLYTAVNNCNTVLTSSMTISQTTATVSSSSCFPASGLASLGSEVVAYTSKDSTHLYGLTRAFDGTTAAAYLSAMPVRMNIVAKYHNTLAGELVAMSTYFFQGSQVHIDSTTVALGIGTATPHYRLDASTSAAAEIIMMHLANTNAGSSAGVTIDLDPAAAGGGVRSSQIAATNNGSNVTTIIFRTANGAPPAEIMRITGTGNVGIGATAPLSKLHIVGTRGGPVNTGTTPTSVIRVANDSNNVVMDLGISTTSAAGWIQAYDKTALGTNYDLLLEPNGNNVAIGTTTTVSALDVVSGGNRVLTMGAWSSWTPSYTGYTGSVTTNLGKYVRMGKTVCIMLDFTGTSNTNAITFTLPVASLNTLSTIAGAAIDNGASLNTPPRVDLGAASSTVNAYKSFDGTAWTNSGTKAMRIDLCYEGS